MRSSLFLSASMLIAASRLAASTRLQGVTTDKAGSPLAGVVVKLVSTGESTVSGPDGSWHLAGTTKVEPRTATRTARAGILARQGGRIVLDADGFRLDGRRGWTGGGVSLPGTASAARTADTSSGAGPDTLSMAWKGAEFRIPLPGGTATGVVGPTSLDTTGLGRFDLRASGGVKVIGGKSILTLSIVSTDTVKGDSLSVRLHLNGTAAEMADLGIRPDLVILYNAAGFYTPLHVEPASFLAARPQLLDPSCPADRRCAWFFDIPLQQFEIQPAYRLEANVVFESHQPGEAPQLNAPPPVHDPLASDDWSFRPHHGGPGPDYAGLTTYAITPSPEPAPMAPYIQILRGNRVLYGRAPTPEN